MATQPVQTARSGQSYGSSLVQQAFGGAEGEVKELKDQVSEVLKGTSGNMIVDIGVAFGKLNAITMAKIEEDVKIIIVATTKQIIALPKEERTFAGLKRLCSHSPFLEPRGDGLSKSDSFIHKDTAVLKIDGSPDGKIVNEVTAWFNQLIADDDILEAAGINIEVLGRVVAQSGATVTNTEDVLNKKERHEKNLDIAGIRYPDSTQPYFRVFRIHLSAWSESDRTLLLQQDNNGIIGDITVCEYKPRETVIATLRDTARANALHAADTFWG